jgi:hypothetical protein
MHSVVHAGALKNLTGAKAVLGGHGLGIIRVCVATECY